MNPLKFTILGIPQPKQSARFKAFNDGTKAIIRSYQNKKTVHNEANIAFDVKSKLPDDFIPMDGPLKVKALFVFPPLKNFTKWKLNVLSSGGIIYKTTKPDLTDNLMKGTMDALNGVVFTDDAIIAEVESKKIYGLVPRIELEFEKLD